MKNTGQGFGEYHRRLYDTPSAFLKFRNRYTFSSEELQVLHQRDQELHKTYTVDLSVARGRANPFEIEECGRAVVIWGVTTATLYDPIANTGVETIANQVVMGCYFNDDFDTAGIFMLKHARGYRGDFRRLSLTNPAQANLSCRIVVFKFDDLPYPSGDFPT